MTRSDVRRAGREDARLGADDEPEDAREGGAPGKSATAGAAHPARDDPDGGAATASAPGRTVTDEPPATDGSVAAPGRAPAPTHDTAAADAHVGRGEGGRWAALDPRRMSTRAVAAVIVLLTAVMLVVAYAGKARCVGPTFDDRGRTTPDYDIRIDRDLCYSDIQYLWLDRDIDKHVFPYIHGGITPPPDSKLTGGTVEYPVLTGLLMWVGALFAHNDGEFLLYSALLMAPFGLLTGWMLGRLARWRALVWALGPPLYLYAFHNWDLPVVACAVAAVYVMHGWRTTRSLRQRGHARRRPARCRLRVQALPGRVRRSADALRAHLLPARPPRLVGCARRRARRHRHGGADQPSVRARGLRRVARLVHVPGAAQGRPHHQLDLVLGLPPRLRAHQRGVPTLGELAVAHARDRLVRARAGRRLWRWRRSGSYPWIAVSAAMLCGFLLLHKVHSPQYTLWLVPFFVLLAVPWRWVLAYMVVDICMDIGVFRWFYAMKLHGNDIGGNVSAGLAGQLVALGVWGRAVLLAVLFVVVLVGRDRLAAQGAPGARPAPPTSEAVPTT